MRISQKGTYVLAYVFVQTLATLENECFPGWLRKQNTAAALEDECNGISF